MIARPYSYGTLTYIVCLVCLEGSLHYGAHLHMVIIIVLEGEMKVWKDCCPSED